MKADIGGQIKKAREFMGLTQLDLASHLGVAVRTIQSWEGNERTPRIGGMEGLAATLQVPLAYFYGHEAAGS